MYVNQTEGNYFRCPAVGCGKQWYITLWPQLRMMDHWEKDNNRAHLSELAKNQHLILWQLYKSSTCLVCRDVFKLPDDGSPNSRALFKHHKEMHKYEEDLSTVEGFITNFRKYPDVLRLTTVSLKKWFETTCELLYEHIKCSLTHGDNPLYGRLQAFMGYSGSEIPEVKLREFFTYEKTKYLPIHPNLFLCYLEYDPRTTSLSRNEWEEVRKILQDLYRVGKI